MGWGGWWICIPLKRFNRQSIMVKVGVMVEHEIRNDCAFRLVLFNVCSRPPQSVRHYLIDKTVLYSFISPWQSLNVKLFAVFPLWWAHIFSPFQHSDIVSYASSGGWWPDSVMAIVMNGSALKAVTHFELLCKSVDVEWMFRKELEWGILYWMKDWWW